MRKFACCTADSSAYCAIASNSVFNNILRHDRIHFGVTFE